MQPFLLLDPTLDVTRLLDLALRLRCEVQLLERRRERETELLADVPLSSHGVHHLSDRESPFIQPLNEAVEAKGASILCGRTDVLHVFPHGGISRRGEHDRRL